MTDAPQPDRQPDPHRERTQRLDLPSGAGGAAEAPISYTEEYGGAGVPERTLVDPGVQQPPTAEDAEADGRTWSTAALAITGVICLLLGIILALMLLPEEEPATVTLDDQAAQDTLADLSAQNDALSGTLETLQAEIAQLQADLAAREAEISQLQSQQAGDQAAADQALADREAALAEREAALEAREAAVAEREEEVAAAGSGDGGVTLPDLGEVDVPSSLEDVELPEIDTEQARGVVERFVDRLQELFGLD